MKKQILISVLLLLLFSAIRSMDQPVKQGKLLFPFPNKTATDVWQMVRETYIAHHYLLESDLFMSLPGEIKEFIQRIWLALNNPPSFSTPQDQFFRKMLGCCITLSCKEKEWSLPIRPGMTHDEKYYLTLIDNKLNIYCRKTKECMRSIIGKNSFTVCKRENLILCGERIENRDDNFRKYSFYDIEKDQWGELGEWMSYSTVENTQLIGGFDDEYLYIWDIADIDAIVCHKIPCIDRKYRFLEFTSDGNILCGTGDQNIVLFTIKDNKLEELARFDFQGLTFPFCELQMMNYDDGQYCIIKSRQLVDSWETFKYQSIGIKIKKNSNGEITLKKVFNVPMSVWSIIDKDAIFVCDQKKQLSIMNNCGQLIHTGDILALRGTYFGRHVFYDIKEDSSELLTPIMAYIKRDACGEGVSFIRKTIENAKLSPFHHRFNRKETLFALRLTEQQDTHQQDTEQPVRFGCFDFNAKNLISFAARGCDFHPSGHALLCENEDHSHKKLVLHPKGADDHFQKLAHKSLKLTQYAALEKMCSEVDELRKKIEQEAKKLELS